MNERETIVAEIDALVAKARESETAEQDYYILGRHVAANWDLINEAEARADIDPADVWDAYMKETPWDQRSPQGAMAFALAHCQPAPAPRVPEGLMEHANALANFLEIALDNHDDTYGETNPDKYPKSWDVQGRKRLNKYRARADEGSAPAQGVPQGWRPVPLASPTALSPKHYAAMISAGWRAYFDYKTANLTEDTYDSAEHMAEIFNAMRDAAPEPPK